MNFDPEVYKELIKTFQGEFDEQVEELTAILLKLENKKSDINPDDINTAFRIAHTIKGSSRSIDINLVADVAHRMEDLFSLVRQGSLVVRPEMIDTCLKSIDMMKQLLSDHVAGKESDEDVASLIAEYGEFVDDPASECDKAKESDGSGVGGNRNHIQEVASVSSQESADEISSADGDADVPSAVAQDQSVESIRVDIGKIDQVTSLVDELQANKLELDDYYEELNKLKLHMEAAALNCSAIRAVAHEGSAEFDEDENAELMNANALLVSMHSNFKNTIRSLGLATSSLQDKVRTLRLVPIDTVLMPMMRSARDVARELGKEVDLTINSNDIRIDRSVLAQAKDPLMHLLRNAIDHGIESTEDRLAAQKPGAGSVAINVTSEGDRIIITMEDDGAGIDQSKVIEMAKSKKVINDDELAGLDESEILKLIFRPGFSTKSIITDISGRGVGLDVVMANVQSMKGDVEVSTELGKGTAFTLTLPMTLVSDRGVVVRAGGQEFAITTTAVARILMIDVDEITEIEAGQAILFEGRPIPLRSLSAALGHDVNSKKTNSLSLIVVKKGWETVALQVDEIVGEREIVIKQLSSPLIKVKNVLGATLTGRGDVIIVLNPLELVKSAIACLSTRIFQPEREKSIDAENATRPKILVVDDSITTRTLESNILNIQGYDVDTSVDGRDAWNKINSEHFDLIITDVNMPKMDGFELAKLIKESEEYRSIPVIIVTSLSDENDKRRGIDVGADAYIIKSQFETKSLIQTVEQLL